LQREASAKLGRASKARTEKLLCVLERGFLATIFVGFVGFFGGWGGGAVLGFEHKAWFLLGRHFTN
jgi:hypothetical protein